MNDMHKLKKRILLEVAIKTSLVLVVFIFFLAPNIMEHLDAMDSSHQGATLSMMGFLMAGAIVGAFELSYSRTNLESPMQRYLAHTTKFFLYLGISALMLIAMWAMATTPGYFIDSIFIVTLMIYISLFLYDFWDVLCATDRLTKQMHSDG